MTMNPAWGPNALLERGRQLHMAGQLQQAEMAYRNVLQMQPDNVTALHMLGALALQVGNIEIALQLTGRVASLQPNVPEFRNNHGIALFEAGRLEEAKAKFQEALSMRSDYAEAHFNLGRTLQRLNQEEEAFAAYRKALKLKPRYAQAHDGLGQLLKAQGKIEDAERHFRRAIEAAPNFADAQVNLGQLLAERRNYDGAIECWRAALSARPNHLQALNNMGLALSVKGELDQAVVSLTRSIALKGDQLPVLLQLGFVQLARHRLSEAEKAFAKALEVQSESSDAYRGLGRTLLEQGRLNEAVEACEHALALKPQDANSAIALSQVLVQAGRDQEALEVLTRVANSTTITPELAFEMSALTGKKAVDAMPAEAVVHLFDFYAERFDSHLVEQLQYRGPKYLREAVESVAPQRTFDVLDLGCGTGLCGAEFKPISKRLVGVDLSPAMVVKCRNRGIYEEVRVGDARSVGEETAAYDLILSGDVFIYMGGLEEVFAACHKALKPGGLLAFTVERSDEPGYVLRRSKRFAHNLAYVQETGLRNGLKPVYAVDKPLRLESDKAIASWIVVMQKQG